MLRRIRAFFAWHTVFYSDVYLYRENSVTGERRACQYMDEHEPKNEIWLNGGQAPKEKGPAAFATGPYLHGSVNPLAEEISR